MPEHAALQRSCTEKLAAPSVSDVAAFCGYGVHVRRMRPALGTFVEIAADSPAAQGAIEAAFDVVQHVARLLSLQRPDSELCRLNAAPGRWLEVSRHTSNVLRLARALGRASHDDFNCTVGGALSRTGHWPASRSRTALASGDHRDIELRWRRARLRRAVLVTLDGIAKGYAVDCAIASLRRAGVRSGWVNAGGDLRVFGDVIVPIRRRLPDGRIELLGGLRDAAVATSEYAADEHDGRHAASPAARLVHRGRAVTARGAWTVVARACWRADALTKIAAVTASDRREARIAAFGGRLVPPAPDRSA